MTYPPQQPGNNWPEPNWAAPEQQQQPYADPYGAGVPTSPGYAGYPPQSYPPAQGYPQYGYGMPPAPPSTNGMAVAALVVSIVGALGLCGYGVGGVIGAVGAILGHVARKQIRQTGEGGDGLALAGVIVGWIAAAIGVVAILVIAGIVLWASTQPTSY
jgi:hypothetical protein